MPFKFGRLAVSVNPGQVRLREAAMGLNYIDVYHRTGYYSQPLPFYSGARWAAQVVFTLRSLAALEFSKRFRSAARERSTHKNFDH